MSKRYSRRMYLGKTRRQKNTRLLTVCITVLLLLFIVVVSACFLAWMLGDIPVLPEKEHTSDDTAVGTASATQDTAAETGADSAPAAETEAAVPETVTITGQPYKVLSYTDTWVVMLDAGHGFDDRGTTSDLLGGVNEAMINLDIVLRIKEILEATGVTVLLTHDTNAVSGRVSVSDGGEMPLRDLVLLTPEDRAVLANGQDIDLYVSVHCDSIPDKPEISGMRMYYCNTVNDVLSAKRNAGAEALSGHIADNFRRNMGDGSVLPRIRALNEDEAYYVIRAIAVPSVLCEVGFVTNKEDAANMRAESWRQHAAQGIADGIVGYMTAAE